MWIKTLRNCSALLGEELQFKDKVSITIEAGFITKLVIGDQNPLRPGEVHDCRGLLAIPGLINAHTHVADSVAKDLGIGLTMQELVEPIKGLKMKILQSTSRASLTRAIRKTLKDMMRVGTVAFADFREGGLPGVKLLQEAAKGIPMKTLVLGRPNYYFPPRIVGLKSRELPLSKLEEVKGVLAVAAGVGLSGPNEYTDSTLSQINSQVRLKKSLLATHAAEAKESMLFSKKTFGKSEVERSLQLLKPDFIVHLTNAQRTDIEFLAREKVSAVCCPRANAALSVGIPPIGKLLKEGVNVALGTDNVMVNSPDLFREMEFALKVTRLAPDKQRTTGLKARHVLKMTTINAAKALRLESELGSIETGKRGSMILLDLNSNNLSDSRDITASVVNRARPDDIASIFVDGEFCHG